MDTATFLSFAFLYLSMLLLYDTYLLEGRNLFKDYQVHTHVYLVNILDHFSFKEIIMLIRINNKKLFRHLIQTNYK